MTQEQLIQFISDRPSINLKSFSNECGISQSLLWLIVNNKRNLQQDQSEKILPIAIKYGWK